MSTRKKPKRNPNGRSTFTNEGKGRWRARVSMGKDPETGKYIRVSVRGTKVEVMRGVAELEARREREKNLGTRRMTLNEWLDRWLAAKLRDDTRESTYANYEGTARLHLRPALGDLALIDITTERVERCLEQMTRTRPVKGNATPPSQLPASAATKIEALKTLRAALNAAVRVGVLDRNPATQVKPPRASPRPIIVLTPTEVDGLFDEAWNYLGPRGLARASVGVLAALRQSEALGLVWPKTDLEQGIIYVHQSRPRRRWNHGCTKDAPCRQRTAPYCPKRWRRPLLDSVKSAAGHRSVLIGPQTVAALSALAEQQCTDRIAAGGRWGIRMNSGGVHEKDGIDWVFVDTLGRRLDHRRDNVEWCEMLKRSGLDHVKLHAARHTGATFALASGTDESTIMKQFGWSTRRMLDVYGRPGTEAQRRLVDRVETMVSDARRNNRPGLRPLWEVSE